MIAGALALAVGLLLPVFGEVSVVGAQTKSLSNARQLFFAARLYADDHEGLLPLHLNDLVPDYIPAEILDHVLYTAKIEEEEKPRLKYDWLYFGAGFDAKNPPPMLIASPHAFKDDKKQKRVVIFADGTGAIVNDEQYQTELRKTIEAMHKRFDAAKPAF